MEWVDFKAIKSSVPIDAILAKYNVHLRKVNQSALRGACPLPTHTSQGAPSFCVNIDKGAWSCKSDSCVAARAGKAGGNILDLVAVMERCSIRDAALKISRWFNITQTGASSPTQTENNSDQLIAEQKREAQLTDASPAELENKPLSFVLKNINHDHPYMAQRGIPKGIAETFGVGHFSGRGSMAGLVVIPIHNDRGELVAYAGRSIDGTEPRYRLPAKFHKSLELFNLHRAMATGSDCVIVVEGFFDCMRVHDAGFPNVVAVMGSSLSNDQETKLVQHFSRATLMLDGDDAGRAATKTIGDRLTRRMYVRVVDLQAGKQPDELSSVELKTILGSL